MRERVEREATGNDVGGLTRPESESGGTVQSNAATDDHPASAPSLTPEQAEWLARIAAGHGFTVDSYDALMEVFAALAEARARVAALSEGLSADRSVLINEIAHLRARVARLEMKLEQREEAHVSDFGKAVRAQAGEAAALRAMLEQEHTETTACHWCGGHGPHDHGTECARARLLARGATEDTP